MCVTKKIALLLVLISFQASTIWSQRNTRIDGNGKITTITRELPKFDKIGFHWGVNAEIILGERSGIEITADENLLPKIISEVKNNELTINQDGWLEGTQKAEMKIYTPSISALFNSSWGNINLEGFNGSALDVRSEVGKISLSGYCKDLTIWANVGEIDAKKLEVSNATITTDSWAKIFINVSDQLTLNTAKNSSIVYSQTPKQIIGDQSRLISPTELSARENQPVEYIKTVLYNNNGKKVNLKVEGPENSPFGYGFSISAKSGKKERFPVGSRIYEMNGEEKEKLLLVISKENENSKVNLY